jgi:hypothetical protein
MSAAHPVRAGNVPYHIKASLAGWRSFNSAWADTRSRLQIRVHNVGENVRKRQELSPTLTLLK